MYADIAPKLQKLNGKLSTPRTYFADVDNGIMVMENLKLKEYNLKDKVEGKQQ